MTIFYDGVVIVGLILSAGGFVAMGVLVVGLLRDR